MAKKEKLKKKINEEVKPKVKQKVKETSWYARFRKLRFALHLTPSYHKFKEFLNHYFGGLYYRIDEHHVFLLGGGLAFSLFVCIVPFTLIIFAVLGTVLDSASMQLQINTLIETLIPYTEYSDFVKEIIFSRIQEVIKYRNIAGIIGGVGILFAASGLFSSMRTILNKVNGLEVELNIIIAKLKDFFLILMVIIIFFFTTFLIPIFQLLQNKADEWPALSFLHTGFFESVLFSLFSFILIFVVFSSLYFSVPVKKLGRKATFVSAFWAAILWEIAKQIFGFYINNFTTLSRIYGAYVLMVVVAFWIYYSSVVFIVGAEIGKLYSERKNKLDEEKEMVE